MWLYQVLINTLESYSSFPPKYQLNKYLSRICLYFLHIKKAWNSQSILSLQVVHKRSSFGILLCLPISIPNLWLEQRKLQNAF
jgi:hypothetical protein